MARTTSGSARLSFARTPGSTIPPDCTRRGCTRAYLPFCLPFLPLSVCTHPISSVRMPNPCCHHDKAALSIVAVFRPILLVVSVPPATRGRLTRLLQRLAPGRGSEMPSNRKSRSDTRDPGPDRCAFVQVADSNERPHAAHFTACNSVSYRCLVGNRFVRCHSGLWIKRMRRSRKSVRSPSRMTRTRLSRVRDSNAIGSKSKGHGKV